MNDELGRMWKEVEVLSRHLSVETEDNHDAGLER
jgi:hypothetical protein